MKLMKSIIFEPGQRPVTDTVPLTFVGPFKQASPGVAEAVPEPVADWPEISTVPGDLIDDDGCPWKKSGFL